MFKYFCAANCALFQYQITRLAHRYAQIARFSCEFALKSTLKQCKNAKNAHLDIMPSKFAENSGVFSHNSFWCIFWCLFSLYFGCIFSYVIPYRAIGDRGFGECSKWWKIHWKYVLKNTLKKNCWKLHPLFRWKIHCADQRVEIVRIGTGIVWTLAQIHTKAAHFCANMCVEGVRFVTETIRISARTAEGQRYRT